MPTSAVYKTLDANEAAARIAYSLSQIIAIYPITPSSPMSEEADAWESEGRPNIWGEVPHVIEMQSEAGAAGTIHGALQTGALATTFTSSQGLLLMIPVMYKIAGELNPTVFHIAARSLATQALSIFGDHSDVMAARSTGFAMLCSNTVQEAQDFALIAHAATLETRVPFMHFFDGFRTSHEIQKIQVIGPEITRAMVSEQRAAEHRLRAMTPDRPVLRGTTQNPDVYFQSRETVNPYYASCPDRIEQLMHRFGTLTGRQYRLYEYHGHPQAERVAVVMGSAADTLHETVDDLCGKGEKVGVLKVRLFRPFDARRLLEAIPQSARLIAVLDRTKEPGSSGEPLYLDVMQAYYSAAPRDRSAPLATIVGGRYGLSSKEFTPAMAKAVLDHLKQPNPRHGFTVGIRDDVSGTSLETDPNYSLNFKGRFEAVFYGLGSDGTVGANKNSIKIIGEGSSHFAQGYFEYDSKKSGAMTVSHLRFGPEPIRSAYLVKSADFIGCHQMFFLERYDFLANLKPGGSFLLNISGGAREAWAALPRSAQEHLIKKKARFFAIDAGRVASECGLNGRINTVMQTAFFAIAGVLPKETAISEIKKAIEASYGRKGNEIVQNNLKVVDQALAGLEEVAVPAKATSTGVILAPVRSQAPDFVRNVLGEIIAGRGDALPVSAFPADGTYSMGTAKYEKRNLATEIPVWEPEICIQCAKCIIACPHSVIRMNAYPSSVLSAKPGTFKHTAARNPAWEGLQFTIQVAPEDCTGCAICVDVCPAKSKSESQLKAINMRPQPPLRENERKNWDFFTHLPLLPRETLDVSRIREQQAMEPLFEFSSACAGCGETPYLKLLSQLFGDHAVIANATGCSSIYGGNLPTTPWTVNADGRGPAWSNSLFENNAEFGLGMRLSVDFLRNAAKETLRRMSSEIGNDLVLAILNENGRTAAAIHEQRERVAELKRRLTTAHHPDAKKLLELADYLVRKTVWIVGGDGWAYDIGFGGLDHVLACNEDVNILVLDTEVYSNTGGQKSKSTPAGAVAKFASSGKETSKKDLGLIAMTYGNVYVASLAMGAKDEHTLKAFLEAEAHDGPSLLIAYSHCIAHGISMSTAMRNQKAAFESGRWPLYRFQPSRLRENQNPLILEKPARHLPIDQYVLMENRFKMLLKSRPDTAKKLFRKIENDAQWRSSLYQYLAAKPYAETQTIESERKV